MVYLFAAKSFVNAKQVAAYLWLIPRLNESGVFKGQTTLSKSGPSRIRAKLYLASVAASTHNDEIRAQRDRLIKAGKTKMYALCAAMRKLVQICFGVIKNQTEYQVALGQFDLTAKFCSNFDPSLQKKSNLMVVRNGIA
jgi:transposase